MLKPKVEAEIERLVKEGVLEPLKNSDWGTPIVPVVKRNGSIRICGDFKVTLNPQIMVDKYPIPKIEEMLANMNGEKFTKIDLANYQGWPMDERQETGVVCLDSFNG